MLGALLAATLAIAGLFGFAVPVLDPLNHTQILLFPATLIGLAIVALALRGAMGSVAMIYAFVGFAASANVMIPEFAAALRARPPAPATDTVTVMTRNLFGLNY
ncbi:MAG: hypothetical protein MO852_06930 [Candidatus Devosia euplotis]|nr:hypothetical protein [Candidatus Devosia euplotis]